MKPKIPRSFNDLWLQADCMTVATFACKHQLVGVTAQSAANTAVLRQVERNAANLTRLGTTHDRKYARLESLIMEGLRKSETFENAQKELGSLLGFIAQNVEREGSPDTWWLSGDKCIAFEDYVNTTGAAALSVEKARQADSQPNWIRANVVDAEDCEIICDLVSPARNFRRAALQHVSKLFYWEYEKFVEWSDKALNTVRELRRDFVEAGDLIWQARAGTILQERLFDMTSMIADITQNPLAQKKTAA